MPARKLPYKEGDWFAVPLDGGGYALGIAARVSRGGGILGYFFGPRHASVPTLDDTHGLRHPDALDIAIFGDLGLLSGEWPIVCETESWTRDAWLMPAFGRVDGIDPSIAFRTTYNENCLSEATTVTRVSPDIARRLPDDGLYGYLALAITLDRLLP